MTPPRSRLPKPPQSKTLEEFCALFGQEVPAHAVRIGPRWFHDPQGLIVAARERGWDPFSGGIYLGEERGGFRPTSALISMLGASSDRRVALESKSAWLYLCGRDILMEGVLGSPGYQSGELVFLVDEQDRILGYGMILNPFDPRHRHAVLVKHLVDRGEYLRRER